ncbi:type I-G CRISPR-associated helicase/endonuclease Cas3g [Timonella sp. A28]|uniref:type I-G CRISPR-associated helicase/endonuclease Cas3g n=1 Tax=Timonella sp. A28 TaxID=3442640 RepID=UPI003EB6AD24
MTAEFPSFETYFEAIHSYSPYTWQSRLAHQVRENSWPSPIAVPTGLGKTATIAIAVYELARQIAHGEQRTAPQRIFHVVDRKILVDSTATYSEHLAEKINSAEPDSPLAPVRAALKTLLGEGETEAIVSSGIHGDRPDSKVWLRATGCSIVSLTSNQYVSRLLMRGFGVSLGASPIAGALTGIDSLVLFDEPHLSQQAVTTIRKAFSLQQQAPHALGLPDSRVVLLGATIPKGLSSDEDQKFELNTTFSSAEKTRINAARTVEMQWTDGKETAVSKQLVNAALEAWHSGAQRIAVFVNTVALAHKVTQLLEKAKHPKGSVQPPEPVLTTSRFRPIDKPVLQDGPLLLVSTQTLEVGVDFSVDHLVTEVCPWGPLVQRLGRLNRDGLSKQGHATIVGGWVDAPVVRKPSAFIYGEEPLHNVQTFLRDVSQEGSIDFSYAGVQNLKNHPSFSLEKLDHRQGRIGTLTRVQLPVLAQTRPRPENDVRVEALIAGPDAETVPEVRVAWRHHLEHVDALKEHFLVDASEVVSVTRSALQSLLTGKTLQTELSDVEAIKDTASFTEPFTAELHRIRIWDSTLEGWTVPQNEFEVLRATDVLLEPEIGGYSKKYGWTGKVTPQDLPDDVSLAAVLKRLRNVHNGSLALASNTFRIPLSPQTLRAAENYAEIHDSSRIIGSFPSRSSFIDEDTYFEEILAWAEETSLELISKYVNALTLSKKIIRTHDDENGFHIVVTCAVKNEKQSKDAAKPVLLHTHQQQVGAWALTDARCAGLHSALADSVAVAGALHDQGKADSAFQKYLANGKVYDDRLAKSLTSTTTPRTRGAQAKRFGVLPGWRHEALSVDLVSARINDPLILHLIGAHHGWYRPLIQPLDAQGHTIGQRHAQEFSHLNSTFGLWGLAYLEALVRLADWRASAHPQDVSFSLPDVPASVVTGAKINEQTTSHKLEGLTSTPLAGWFTSVALLAAAREHEDVTAHLHWEPTTNGGAPTVPVLSTTIPLKTLVAHVLRSDDWHALSKFSENFGDTSNLLSKNQKFSPITGLNDALENADNQNFVMPLVFASDLAAADTTKEGGGLPLNVPVIANNSNYISVAMRLVHAYETSPEVLDEIVEALRSINAGYSPVQCDGGMDRARASSKDVNGMVSEQRVTRSMLSPLVVYGISRLNSAGHSAPGMRGRPRSFAYPLPTAPSSLEEINTLLFTGFSQRGWAWQLVDNEWVLFSQWQSEGKSENFWVSDPVKRSEVLNF